MIRVDDLKKIVRLVLATGYIKKAKPLSLLIIGKVGIGKTELIKSYKSPTIKFLTDLSMMGLLKLLEKEKRIRHILIPDFLKITMKKRTTSDNLISILNAFVEEGIEEIRLGNYFYDFKNRSGGIIIATTKASWEQHKNKWKSFGFVSRMLICSYSYSEATIKQIIEYINQEKYLIEKSFESLKYKKQLITSTPKINARLNTLGNNVMRTQKQLQTLIKANALLRSDIKTTIGDVNEIYRLSEYLNLKYKEI